MQFSLWLWYKRQMMIDFVYVQPEICFAFDAVLYWMIERKIFFAFVKNYI